MRALFVVVAVGLVIAAGACALIHTESELLFPGSPGPHPEPDAAAGVEPTWLDVSGDRVEAFLLLPALRRASPAPLVIYTHGNGELVDFWLSEFSDLRAAGIAVLLVEYPGYGRSTGTPSERSIQQALAAGYDWATAHPDVDSRRVIGYGRSLGGGAICSLGRVRSLAALILESTFTSVRDIAQQAFHVPGFLVRNRFDSLDFVGSYGSPVLVRHGESDSSIPVSHAHRLAEAAHAGQLEILACGHNDCGRSHASILGFLAENGLL